MKVKTPRIMIAADKSGSGKTAITALIVYMLKKKGYKPALFKSGPDYLDPLFHEKVNHMECGNLDSFFCKEDELKSIFYSESIGCDIGIVEGVMGYYDGKGEDIKGSSCSVASLLETPVVLIVDAKGRMQSILAEIYGYINFLPGGKNIKAVILNRASKKVYEFISQNIKDLGVRVLGYIPECAEMKTESRYLGLVMPKDATKIQRNLSLAAEKSELDINGLIDIAKSADELSVTDYFKSDKDYSNVKVAIAKDEVFCFLYRENVLLLKGVGAEIVYFSPLHDKKLPFADAYIFPGGYPEDYAKELSENVSMLSDIRGIIKAKKPVLAECGGFLYLHEKLTTKANKTYSLAGVVKGEAKYKGLCKGFGYKELISEKDYLLAEKNEEIKCHEFHHFSSESDTLFGEKIYAGFCHIPFAGNKKAMYRFLEAAL